MLSKLRGTGVAIVTPFYSDGQIDFDALGNIVEHIISNGVNYLVVLGTTGESVTLSKEEKLKVVARVKETNAGRVPIVLGNGGNDTEEVIAAFDSFDLEGVDAILSVSPAYNKPTQEGIYQHYAAIAKASPLPIILYNVPGRTSSNVSADTTLRLAGDFDNIIAMKEASGDMDQIMKIIHNRPDDFLVLSGDDGLTLSMLAAGADGVISVIANAWPREFSNMVKYALANDMDDARREHYKLYDLLDPLYCDGNPAGVKAALQILGLCGNNLRLPLVPVQKETYKRLETLAANVSDLSPV